MGVLCLLLALRLRSGGQQSCPTTTETRVYTTAKAPLLSRSVAQPRGHRAKKSYVVCHFVGKLVTRERVYTIGPERGVYTVEASDLKKDKMRGFHGGGVCFFSSLNNKESLEVVVKVCVFFFPAYT